MKYLILILALFSLIDICCSNKTIPSDSTDSSHISKSVIVYDTIHKRITVYDTIHKTTTITVTDTIHRTVRVTTTDTVHKTLAITDTIYNTVTTTVNKYDTVHVKINKYDTVYNTIIITDTLRKTVTVTDTLHRSVTVTDTLYKTITDTLHSTLTITDTLHKTLNITDTLRKTLTITDTLHKILTVSDTVHKIVVITDTVTDIPVTPPDTGDVKWGVSLAQTNTTDEETICKAHQIKLIRVAVFFSQTTVSQTMNQHLSKGFNVQVNLNWKPTGSPVEFPTDTSIIRTKMHEFFQYYAPYVAQIPIVVIENEWDNEQYHNNDLSYYFAELKIAVQEGHKFGFKIADAGITSTAIRRWTYSKLTPTDQIWWKQNYFVGPTMTNYQPLIDKVNRYASNIRTIGIDYLNFHWYEEDNTCHGKLDIATTFYKTACGKSVLINNEFGLKTKTISQWNCLLSNLNSAGIVIGVAYSGIDAPDLAITLTDDMLNTLR